MWQSTWTETYGGGVTTPVASSAVWQSRILCKNRHKFSTKNTLVLNHYRLHVQSLRAWCFVETNLVRSRFQQKKTQFQTKKWPNETSAYQTWYRVGHKNRFLTFWKITLWSWGTGHLGVDPTRDVTFSPEPIPISRKYFDNQIPIKVTAGHSAFGVITHKYDHSGYSRVWLQI